MKTPKQFRIVIYIAGRECVGEWREMDLQAIAKDAMIMAENGMRFTVEFQRETYDKEINQSLSKLHETA